MGNRVFLIEDVDATRALLRLLLLEMKFQVVGEAGTIFKALQLLPDANADMVMLDLNLPDGDGIEMVARVLEVNPQMVIVVVSAHNDASSVQKALQKGAHGYLIKPFTPKALESCIARAQSRASNMA
jgi:two-component system chemotaxis response regulator CheY